MFIFAFSLTKSARFGTCSEHVSRILFAFAPTFPLSALFIIVVASSFEWLFIDFTQKQVANAARFRAVAIHPSGIARTFTGVCPSGAVGVFVLALGSVASLRAFVVWASALAFVVEKARLLTSLFLCRGTLSRARVHDVHDLLVAKGKVHRFAHGEDVGDVVGHNCDSI